MMNDEVFTVCKIEERTVCPAHPGEILKGAYLEPARITITDFAETIGVSRKAVSEIINGHKRVTPEMALRFAAALSTTPGKWIQLQANYDLWQAAHAKLSILTKIVDNAKPSIL